SRRVLVWKKLSARQRAAALARPLQERRPAVSASVRRIVAAVRRGGDAALLRLTRKFDGVALESLRVREAEFVAAEKALPSKDKAALRAAFRNIRAFHAAQQSKPIRVVTQPGIVCEKRSVPIGCVGLYVPGGTAPLPSTAMMLGVPSMLAGNPTRVLCTPPARDGSISPWILFSARLCGITEVYKVGGAQAIAAMAFGTRTVPKCDKIFGPGNAWVTEAKQQVSLDPEGAAIDMPAGPSELMVIADRGANPAFVAADLLSQAEHGPDSQVILVAFSAGFAKRVAAQVAKQLARLPRRAIASRALESARVLIASDADEAVAIANAYAPEHLIINTGDPRALLPRITTAGSVFLGAWTPESLGDYASGTNHVLPTAGWARSFSGLGLADFQHNITVQSATAAGLTELGPVVERIARGEGLVAHERAVSIRLKAFRK
ncbi:MAG TPA: histidinol dehydrogenase, partial [Opitutaceae bacterium]|nr:histidinol dehydrogenase [Opitutaceae bacterium]